MKNKILKNSIIIFIITIFFTMGIITNTFAKDSVGIENPLTNPDAYAPSSTGEVISNNNYTNTLIVVITNIAIIVSVISVIILGIRYIVGSIEQKADYKKTMIPMAIGMIMVGSISTIIRFLYEVSKSAIG